MWVMLCMIYVKLTAIMSRGPLLPVERSTEQHVFSWDTLWCYCVCVCVSERGETVTERQKGGDREHFCLCVVIYECAWMCVYISVFMSECVCVWPVSLQQGLRSRRRDPH